MKYYNYNKENFSNENKKFKKIIKLQRKKIKKNNYNIII